MGSFEALSISSNRLCRRYLTADPVKLLLVEDNRELSSWVTKLLCQSGYVVEQAFTGEEA